MVRSIRSFASLTALLALSQTAFAGYTHYWTWLKPPDEALLSSCIADMQKIIDASKSRLAILPPGRELVGTELETDCRIGFNGIGSNECEPFIFPGRRGFNFCKTQWMNYDDVVLACLLVARDHFGPDVIEINSDGSWEEGSWQKGAALYEATFHRTPRNPMGARVTGSLPQNDNQQPPEAWSPERKLLAFVAAGVAACAALALLRRRDRSTR